MYSYIFTFLSFIFGLIIGSFLNCLVWRLHTKESMLERSKCPKCGKMIAWYDNIPLLSYIFLLGKCRHCKSHISFQYPAVELITGLLFAIALNFEFRPEYSGLNLNSLLILKPDYFLIVPLLRDYFLISVMIIVFIYDLRWYLILDIVTLPAIAVLVILNLFLGFTWQSLLLGALFGGGFFLFQFVVSRGKWIGGGDIRLGFLMGIALGWPKIITALMLAYIGGSIISIGLLAFRKKNWNSQIPFGIFLSVATIATLFWGDFLIKWYLGIIGIR